MSLKAFHVLFILLSILLAFGFGIWGLQQLHPPAAYLTGGGSFLFGIVLMFYFFRFLEKFKGVSLW